jgi:hypothetical protein
MGLAHFFTSAIKNDGFNGFEQSSGAVRISKELERRLSRHMKSARH